MLGLVASGIEREKLVWLGSHPRPRSQTHPLTPLHHNMTPPAQAGPQYATTATASQCNQRAAPRQPPRPTAAASPRVPERRHSTTGSVSWPLKRVALVPERRFDNH